MSTSDESLEKTIEAIEESKTKKIYIKYFLIGDIDTSKIITEYSTNLISSKEKKNAIQIFKRICKSNERRYEENNIITAKDNKYYFSLFQPSTVFISYALNSYPQTLIFELFEEIRKSNILTLINEETKELNPNGRQDLKQMIEKYQENEKLKRFEEIKKDIDDVKIEIKKSVNNMLDNVESMENLEERINELNEETKEYMNNAEYDKKITWWQNAKFRIIALSIVIFIIVVVLWFWI
jgi:hypothetical protein